MAYVGEKNAKFGKLTNKSEVFDKRYYIFAGKFRRYHKENWIRRLLDIKTIILNARDIFFVFIGIMQAFLLLARIKPNVVFAKGGFVSVPVGIAARILRIPYVTHDSDIVPGLSNKIIGKRALFNLTGLPPKFYPYAPSKARQVGIPTDKNYVEVDKTLKNRYREELNIPINSEVILITGGSQGAKNVNDTVVQIADDLLKTRKGLYIFHQVGSSNANSYGSYNHKNLIVKDFIKEMYRYSGAADIVITRASMTTIAELGVQGKPIIVIPHPYLTDGHQLRNAEYIKEQGAGIVLEESELVGNPKLLAEEIERLLDDPNMSKVLSSNLHKIIRSNSANEIAKILINES